MQERTKTRMRRRRTAMCALVVSGCVRAGAKTLPSGPPLDVPAPPPRIVLPIEAEVPPGQPVPPPQTRPGQPRSRHDRRLRRRR